MILDFRHNARAIPQDLLGGTCRVDGVEVKQVWYVDTDAGIVKSYDVLGDGRAHHATEPVARNAEILDNEVWSKTIRGKIELFRADGSPYAGPG